VTPYQSLLRQPKGSTRSRKRSAEAEQDPGFQLKIKPTTDETDDGDVARTVLDNFVLRAQVELTGDRLRLAVFRRNQAKPSIAVVDRYSNTLGPVYADIRFYPQRKGTFTGLPVDGRQAKTWVKTHSGVAVFDRTFASILMVVKATTGCACPLTPPSATVTPDRASRKSTSRWTSQPARPLR